MQPFTALGRSLFTGTRAWARARSCGTLAPLLLAAVLCASGPFAGQADGGEGGDPVPPKRPPAAGVEAAAVPPVPALRRRNAGAPVDALAVPDASFAEVLRIGKGQSLFSLLTGAGVPAAEADAAARELRAVVDLRRLGIGDAVTVLRAVHPPPEAGAPLTGLRLRRGFDTEVGVTRLVDGDFRAFERPRELRHDVVRAAGTIRPSLFEDAAGEGAPDRIILEAYRIFAFDVDFERDLQPGDGFDLMFETHEELDGSEIHYGSLLYAALRLGGKELARYRFEAEPGDFGYFNADGESARKALLRTPVDAARVSSKFGKRRHPILGYTRMHRGVDFAAPTGTPVRAAGRGVVVARQWKGNYGRYIRIRHGGGYQTAYAHLRRYAKRLRRGSRVAQGQVIGYVGSSGLSTGPHLHYEVIRDGRQINPMTLKLPSGIRLSGGALERFGKRRDEIAAMLACTDAGMLLAASPRPGP